MTVQSNSVFERFSGLNEEHPGFESMGGTACCGFPSPAADYMTDAIDLNAVLTPRRPATFFARADADAPESGVMRGDLVIIDKSLLPRRGDVVVVWDDGEFRVERHRGDEQTPVWGVVTHTVHCHRLR